MSPIENHPVKTVAGFSPYNWEHALVHLRITRPLQQAGIQLLRSTEPSGVRLDNISLADAVLIQREFADNLEMYQHILTRARAEHKAVIYEIDDLLLELPDEHPDRPTDYYTPALFSILQAIIEADLVTVTTPTLQAYLRSFNPNIALLPNYLDDQTWELKEPASHPALGVEHWPVVIGFMGSNTHLPDLSSILPALENLIQRYSEKLRLRFWGGQPPEALGGFPNVEWTPLTLSNYVEFAAFFSQQECDIFLAPLVDSLFNRCKSAIKFLEYSSLGIPGVYSRITPYEQVIQDGLNGFLASTAPEWEQKLTRLIEEPALRSQMGQNAQQTVRQEWLLSQNAYRWQEAYHQAQAIAANPQAQETKQEYLQMFIRVSAQVRAWNHKIYRQTIQQQQTNLELQGQINALKLQLANDQAQLAQLQVSYTEKDRFQQEITRSTAWKFVQAAWRLRLFLMPHGSRRERLAKKILGLFRP